MAKGTKRTNKELAKKLEYAEALKSWNGFIMWLAEQVEQDTVEECMEYEISLACRPAFIDRMRTKFNKIRAYNELKDLEARIGKVINVNYV